MEPRPTAHGMEKPYFRIVAPPVRAAFQTKAVTPVTDAQLTATSFFAACASDKNSPEHFCSGEFLSIKMQRSAPPNQGIVPNIRRCVRYFGYVRAAVFSASVLFEFQPACIKLIVLSVLSDKLFVVSALDYPSVLKHHDHVGIADRREPVRDNENRSASVRVSIDEVASSSIITGGSATAARAIEIS